MSEYVFSVNSSIEIGLPDFYAGNLRQQSQSMCSTAHTQSCQTFCACAKQNICEYVINWMCPEHIALTACI